MNTRSGIVRLTGILCLVLTAIVIAWYLLETWPPTDAHEAAAALQGIAASPGRFLGFMSIDVLYNFGIIVLGSLFYLIFRPHSQSLAFFGFIGFLVTGMLWLVWDFPAQAQYHLALEYSKASGAAADAIALRAADFGLAVDYLDIIDSTPLAVGFLTFGALILRTRAVHRLLGLLALALGIGILMEWYGMLTMIAGGVDAEEASVLWDVVWYAFDAWFLLTGLWLLVKGVKEAPAAAPGR